ncbi:ADP-ribosylation/Crystallin J1 (modular protein) [Candidatus Terasakiella magnetica]|uniref:ADP-ribosylation/Crystallin J1 (Modular protein) n=1 Tax=Candidatus Terasakiella magnetica TaxID=1867952 RepID=A0A1C3RF58_9PROT|nr:ADP-ribosylglycohydrolase family protein [Candidatus Terasakiella magnetica]SCA55926.1 ADP-ribosylation/Crystallin J1 (modular protein) [Candidatus Terasakiella magnetica]
MTDAYSSSDKYESIVVGQSIGDKIGGPSSLANILLDSVYEHQGFDAYDVVNRYVSWWDKKGFDTGPVAEGVFCKISEGTPVTQAVFEIDESLKGMTAGCGPLHRSVVLAGVSFLDIDQLEKAAYQEAKLTHLSDIAAYSAVASVRIARLLATGVKWENVIENCITDLPEDVVQSIVNWHRPPADKSAFSLSVLHSALHFVGTSESFDEALERSIAFAGSANYSPVLSGAFAGALWGGLKPDKVRTVGNSKIHNEYKGSTKTSPWLIGAITGDVVGSIYEGYGTKRKDFPLFGHGCRFTDDTICTVAIADCLMNGGDVADYLRKYVKKYPHSGYGGMFKKWANDPSMGPYDSWGNGSAMRVSPVPYFAKDFDDVLYLAEYVSSATHNHPEGIKGAQAVAVAIWMALHDAKSEDIRSEISSRFQYDLSKTVDEIRPDYRFDVSCAGSVPQAIICALEATDFEDAIRNAISIGGDSDTIACIAGSIAEALFGVPDDIAFITMEYLNDEIKCVLSQYVDVCKQLNKSKSKLSEEISGGEQRSVAALVGLAIGDALGAPIQFMRRDTYQHVSGYTAGGTYSLEPGFWTDDTSMALCLAETLIEKNGYDAFSFGEKLIRWVDDGYNSSLPRCFDIGDTTLRAISNYNRTKNLDCGITGKWAGGNGSIMRLSPVSIFGQNNADMADIISVEQGQFTHNHFVPNFACRMLNAIIIEGIKTGNKQKALQAVDVEGCPEELFHLINGDYKNKSRDEIKSDGYVVSTLEAAMWAVWQTENFKDALLLAVNLGDDADTVGAVTGQIAGAIYGMDGIPSSWVSELHNSRRILELANQLYSKRYQAD